MLEQERKELRTRTSAAIDLLVSQGRVERVVIDGKPGVRLVQPKRVMGVPSLHTQRELRWPDRSAQRKTGYPQKLKD